MQWINEIFIKGKRRSKEQRSDRYLLWEIRWGRENKIEELCTGVKWCSIRALGLGELDDKREKIGYQSYWRKDGTNEPYCGRFIDGGGSVGWRVRCDKWLAGSQ